MNAVQGPREAYAPAFGECRAWDRNSLGISLAHRRSNLKINHGQGIKKLANPLRLILPFSCDLLIAETGFVGVLLADA